MTRAFVWSCVLIGTGVRALPLFDPSGRGLRQFASEDGYLMLTIARNLATGNGMSVEDGLTLTNGTQPLMTFIYGAGFWLCGGDKVSGVVLAQVLGIGIALTCAYLLYRVGQLLLADDPAAEPLCAWAAGAWYVAPLSARYSQNCLETGAATLLPLIVGLYFLSRSPARDERWTIRGCATLGALLGAAFWVRNDAVLLSAATCLVLVVAGARSGSVGLSRSVLEAGVVGATALVVVSPWLAFNQFVFGHLVPISGISQGEKAELGQNLELVPSILAEQVSIIGLIPQRLETSPGVLLGSTLLVIAWVIAVYALMRKAEGTQRRWLTIVALWSTAMVAFYGIVYGAGYFMGRYLFPLSPWMALFTVVLANRAWKSFGSRAPRIVGLGATACVLAISLGLHARAHARGTNNGHFQVVDWVGDNVGDDVWVAAIQTGTLGFFHDKTFNLDGKVSPASLRARQAGRILEYVVDGPTQYLVDWVGIAAWMEDEVLSEHFELLLLDEDQNLAVLGRRGVVLEH